MRATPMDELPDGVPTGRDWVCEVCGRSLWRCIGASREWLDSALALHQSHCRGEKYTELDPEPVTGPHVQRLRAHGWD